MWWCTNCQGYRAPASDTCGGACQRDCFRRCSDCQKYTIVEASSEIARQQSQVQTQTDAMIQSVNKYGGSFECKVEDRRPDGSVFRTTTWAYKR